MASRWINVDIGRSDGDHSVSANTFPHVRPEVASSDSESLEVVAHVSQAVTFPMLTLLCSVERWQVMSVRS